jgi:CheY-like chemotaxis protein
MLPWLSRSSGPIGGSEWWLILTPTAESSAKDSDVGLIPQTEPESPWYLPKNLLREVRLMSLPIRVLIADSDVTFSANLERYLDKQQGLAVIDIVRDGQGAVNVCREALPDMVLIDLHLPVLDSIRAIRAILAQNEGIRILGMTAIPNDRYVVEAVKAGASGCLEKNCDIHYHAIVQAIEQVVAGEVLLNPTLASSILQEFHRLAE